ncbi:MAG: nucleotidyltransferase family protein [Coriobacteriales bacterium]|jgi:molybdenum cofactor cytidylyltransferase
MGKAEWGSDAGHGARLGARGHESCCVAILAAGASARMGTCKLLLPFSGSTLLRRAVEEARRSCADEVVVVTGRYATAMRATLADCGARELENRAWAEGQSTSVALAAAHAARSGTARLLVMTCDQPFVDASVINRMVSFARRDVASGSPRLIHVAQVGTRRGNPCVFESPVYGLLERLEGDEGARSLMRALPQLVAPVPMDGVPSLFDDVDTPGDFVRVEEAWEKSRRCASMRDKVARSRLREGCVR